MELDHLSFIFFSFCFGLSSPPRSHENKRVCSREETRWCVRGKKRSSATDQGRKFEVVRGHYINKRATLSFIVGEALSIPQSLGPHQNLNWNNLLTLLVVTLVTVLKPLLPSFVNELRAPLKKELLCGNLVSFLNLGFIVLISF